MPSYGQLAVASHHALRHQGLELDGQHHQPADPRNPPALPPVRRPVADAARSATGKV